MSSSDRTPLVEDLLCRGWTIVHLDVESLTQNEVLALSAWEETFAAAFALPASEKEAAGSYRTECGVSVGYRVESEREFFETRIRSDASTEPLFAQVASYDIVVQNLYSALNKAAAVAFSEVATYMQIDYKLFLDITDIETNGILAEMTMKSKATGETCSKPNLSSTLLRICKYQDALDAAEGQGNVASEHIEGSIFKAPARSTQPEDDVTKTPTATGSVWFGAHTDSSLLTLSLCSSTPGLDIVDQKDNRWVAPELLAQQRHCQEQALQLQRLTITDPHHDVDRAECDENASCSGHGGGRSANRNYIASGKVPVIVFVGEFLQILSKGRFRAAVHRVRDVGATHRVGERHDDSRIAVGNNTDKNVDYGGGANSTNDSGGADRNDGADASGTLRDSCAPVSSGECINSQSRTPVRISCPYLIRGRHDAILDIHNTARYTHPGGAAAIAEENMPDLDGTSVKLMYKLLDLKRQRCFREHGSAEGGNWVLSGYPVPPLPTEED
jgi:isopenicillin N synthase-like dioxygenase